LQYRPRDGAAAPSLHCGLDEPSEGVALSDFALEVQALRPQLLRFARCQLRNDNWAEDAVSEAMLVCEACPRYARQVTLMRWALNRWKTDSGA
jgi:DNA-directed RNA polymerase specialized sigma24 family protein